MTLLLLNFKELERLCRKLIQMTFFFFRGCGPTLPSLIHEHVKYPLQKNFDYYYMTIILMFVLGKYLQSFYHHLLHPRSLGGIQTSKCV